jgi:hypothetical protein
MELDYNTGADGRAHGTVKGDQDSDPRPFTGTIELLRLLEDIVSEAHAR